MNKGHRNSPISRYGVRILSTLGVLVLIFSSAMVFIQQESESDAEGVSFNESDYSTVEIGQSDIGNLSSPQNSHRYVLTEDVTISSQISISTTVWIELNGHSVTATGAFDTFRINMTGILVLSDKSPDGNGTVMHSRDESGEIVQNGRAVFCSGTFYLLSGNLSYNRAPSTPSNQAYSGGGLFVENYGNAFLNGGSISYNTSSGATGNYGGGGVFVNNGGKLHLSGDASISHNVSARNAGGILVFNTGYMEMTGGHIDGNTAANSGGGLLVRSDFVMKGGTIDGNQCGDHGGGVYSVRDKTFTISGGSISGNNTNYNPSGSNGQGGGLYCGYCTMTGGNIEDNNAKKLGGGVYIEYEFVMSSGSISGNTTALFGGGVYVHTNAKNVNISGTSIISGNRSQSTSDGGGGIAVYGTGTNFLISGGDISGNWSASNGGGVYSKSPLSMTGGRIGNYDDPAKPGNHAEKTGGGIFITASFTMNGGRVSDNETKIASGCSGGAIEISSNEPFLIAGGTIDHNRSYDGGALHAKNGTFGQMAVVSYNSALMGGGLYAVKDGTVYMYGGAIHHNTALSGGGGFFTHGALYIYDGSMTENQAGWAGGAIMTWNTSTVEMYAGTISGNYLVGGTDIAFTADKGYCGGAGIYVNKTFRMYGGTIENNYFAEDSDGNTIEGTTNNKLVSGRALATCNSTSVLLKNGKISEDASAGDRYAIYARGEVKIDNMEMTGRIQIDSTAYVYASNGTKADSQFVLKDSKLKTLKVHRVSAGDSDYAVIVVPNGLKTTTLSAILDYENTIHLSETSWLNSKNKSVDVNDSPANILKQAVTEIHPSGTTQRLYTVIFETGGAVGKPPALISFVSGTVTLPDNSSDGRVIFGLGDYDLGADGTITFNDGVPLLSGWCIKGDEQNTVIMKGDHDDWSAWFAGTDTVVMVPVWLVTEVVYDLGTAPGSIQNGFVASDGKVHVSRLAPEYDGYIFAGWSYTSSDGTKRHCAQGAVFDDQAEGTVTLTAVWLERHYTAAIIY